MMIRSFLLSLLCSFGVVCGAGETQLTLSLDEADPSDPLWVALNASPGFGSTVVETGDGHRVFLAFQADVVLRIEQGDVRTLRVYRDFRWSAGDPGSVAADPGEESLLVDLSGLEGVDRIRAVRWFSSSGKPQVYLPTFYAVTGEGTLVERGRYGMPGYRPRIYQILPRLFGNENQTRKVNGTLAENASGKFSDLSEAVLEQFREDGFTHLWLTGVLQQATSTDYADIGQPADDPDLLKGIAGSPYAIKDYFDVSPDYADDPARRLEEFRALTERMHDDAARAKALLDRRQ
mgnify:CR=1 FL=1